MTGPQIDGSTEAGYRVWCDEHGLDREVATEAHATNLLALHLRVDHPAPPGGPPTLDLTAAARYLLVCYDDRDEGPEVRWSSGAYFAALDMWQALTGLADDEALAYARVVAAGRQVTAVLPPF